MVMKAAYREIYGGAEVLEWREIPTPEPSANEVRVKVVYTSVNRTDSEVVMGNYWLFRLFTGLFRPKYPVPGADVCGIIDKIGAGVTQFQVGDRVVGLNDNSHPTQVEYSVWPEKSSLRKIPSEVSFKDIIACAEGGYYTLNFINKVNMKTGDRVMVNGGTGAIGSSAIQILKQMGCTVVATRGPSTSSSFGA